MKYYVCVQGCDNSTWLDIEATAEEAAFLHRLVKTCNETRNASDEACMPAMAVYSQELFDKLDAFYKPGKWREEDL